MVMKARESAGQNLGRCQMPRAKHCEFVNEFTADPKRRMKRHRFMNEDTFATMDELKQKRKSRPNHSKQKGNGNKTSRRKKDKNSSTVAAEEGSRTVARRRNGDGKRSNPRTPRMGRKSRREQKYTGPPLQRERGNAADGAAGTKRRRSRPRRVQQRVCGDNLDDESMSTSNTQSRGRELGLSILDLNHSRSMSMSSVSSSSSIPSPSTSPSMRFVASLRAPLTPLVDVAEP